jgi:2-isopropylmalate synthase
MQTETITKYQAFPFIPIKNRKWPDRAITSAPIWCSVDLRDGNQALAIPMNVEEKLDMFETLVRVGFKEIEVGFPSASQIEFDFMRRLIEEKRVPDDVSVQVLVQSRADLIERTFESLQGAKRAIVHLYNSTSPVQRRVVFGLEKKGVVDLAIKGTEQIRQLAQKMRGTKIAFEYSPESFSSTEVEFAVEICEAVTDTWQPTPENKIILNLPATVEVATPNIYADQIEWFCSHYKNRERAIISLHTHNDRGCGVAATELGLLAGADRVEGTLFGNGERTGNVDIVTLALNMYTQGVNPGLDFSDIHGVRDVYERCTRLEVPIRHPYAGELVFTAFSGSHQDAINKGLKHQKSRGEGSLWEVPYLPIDPKDIGCNYKAIIRINSQSGKGGVAYILEHDFGYHLPKAMHREIGRIVNEEADEKGDELPSEKIHEIFQREYIQRNRPYEFQKVQLIPNGATTVTLQATWLKDGKQQIAEGKGNGPVDAFVHALQSGGVEKFELISYAEHSLGRGAEARAAAYIEIKTARKRSCFGVGIDTNIELASLKAIISALNRAVG